MLDVIVWNTLTGDRVLDVIGWSTLTGDRVLDGIGWSTLTCNRVLDAIGWSTLTGDRILARLDWALWQPTRCSLRFFEYFLYRSDRFGRRMARFVAIWQLWRYIKNDFSGKSLQGCEIHPIFAVRKTKNLKQVTTNKNNNPLKNIRLWSLSHSSPSQSLLQ